MLFFFAYDIIDMGEVVMDELKKITSQFNIDGELLDIKCNVSGNINKTFFATYKMSTGEIKHFIFQKINTTVFKEPYKLMKNITNITDFIDMKAKFSDDNTHPSLKVIKTNNNKPLAVILDKNGEKQYYRAYNCIENSISYDVSDDENVVYNTGKAFGHFQKMLIDYPTNNLEETIADFHNTPKRYKDFLSDVELDVCDRAYDVSREITFLIKNAGKIDTITSLLEKGKIPLRVTHNDTKVNNVMMDKNTGEYLTVIDLDTVMLGSSLYDYGDGVRSTASTSLEDEKDLDKVFLNTKLFEAYTRGYLSEMAEYLTEDEVCNMGASIEIITFELGLRFLNDYINGDTYFKTSYDKHNLVRARNQFKLLSDIINKRTYIDEFILKTYKENKQKIKK